MHSFDLCIIGAGPAGLLAGIIAASAGSRVILLEKNPEAGKKLLLTGKGRCNLTHAASSAKEITEAFGKNGRFLHSGLSRFGIAETFRFFENLGIPLKVERGNRVFPESGSAKDVRDRLLEEFSRKGGVFRMNCPVHALETSPRMVNRVLLKDKSVIEASRFIIATGGLSYPRTGSTGDGYRWAKTLGHTINPTLPALSPVRLAEGWGREVSGLSLKNVRLTLLVDGKETESRFGELDFTPFGISGPIGMDLSRNIGYALNQQQKTELKLDLKPALDFKSLDRRILRELNVAGSKPISAVLETLMPKKLIPPFARLCSLSLEQKTATLTKEKRLELSRLLKAVTLKPLSLLGFKWSLITSGGISLDEVDPRTMASKLTENLYFAGEILDLDAPTGGYNLQACWTTGYVAGISAAALPPGCHRNS